MPNWHEIGQNIQQIGSPYDVIRREYLRELSNYTGRNTIIYYSGWLQKQHIEGVDVNDADKNGLMTVIHKLDRTKGLDLVLHTPGGNTAATESIVDYLHSMFGHNIRAIVPQLAMSAGTMIACSCKEIIMGLQSSLGPIDPQLNGIPAHGIVEEFNRAYNEIKQASLMAAANPGNPNFISDYQAKLATWQPIIAKYSPALIGECEKAIAWSETMVKEWLTDIMFEDLEPAERDVIINAIIKELGDHAISKSHGRHLSYQKCVDIGLKIVKLEDDPTLQDLVLSVHHSCIHTLSSTNAIKIIENQNGIASIQGAQNIVVPR